MVVAIQHLSLPLKTLYCEPVVKVWAKERSALPGVRLCAQDSLNKDDQSFVKVLLCCKVLIIHIRNSVAGVLVSQGGLAPKFCCFYSCISRSCRPCKENGYIGTAKGTFRILLTAIRSWEGLESPELMLITYIV